MTKQEKKNIIISLAKRHYDEDAILTTFYNLYCQGKINGDEFEELSTSLILNKKLLSTLFGPKE